MYQAGTLSGNPAAVAAGLATLKILREHKDEIYPAINAAAARIETAFKAAIEKYNVPATVNRAGSLMTIFFTKQPVTSFSGAVSSDLEMFKRYFAAMLDENIYIAPSQFEAFFVGFEHKAKEVEKTAAAIDKALSQCI